MSVENAPPDPNRHRRNLEAVARHLMHGGDATPAKDATANAAPAAGTAGRAPAQDPSPPVPTSVQPAGIRQRIMKWLGPVGVGIAFAAGKLKLVLPLLKLAKLGTLLSMLLTIWLYAQVWGM